LKANNKFSKQTITLTLENSKLPEKRVDIPMVDNKEFR